MQRTVLLPGGDHAGAVSQAAQAHFPSPAVPVVKGQPSALCGACGANSRPIDEAQQVTSISGKVGGAAHHLGVVAELAVGAVLDRAAEGAGCPVDLDIDDVVAARNAVDGGLVGDRGRLASALAHHVGQCDRARFV